MNLKKRHRLPALCDHPDIEDMGIARLLGIPHRQISNYYAVRLDHLQRTLAAVPNMLVGVRKRDKKSIQQTVRDIKVTPRMQYTFKLLKEGKTRQQLMAALRIYDAQRSG